MTAVRTVVYWPTQSQSEAEDHKLDLRRESRLATRAIAFLFSGRMIESGFCVCSNRSVFNGPCVGHVVYRSSGLLSN
jgi:hypothetical protein